MSWSAVQFDQVALIIDGDSIFIRLPLRVLSVLVSLGPADRLIQKEFSFLVGRFVPYGYSVDNFREKE